VAGGKPKTKDAEALPRKVPIRSDAVTVKPINTRKIVMIPKTITALRPLR